MIAIFTNLLQATKKKKSEEIEVKHAYQYVSMSVCQADGLSERKVFCELL